MPRGIYWGEEGLYGPFVAQEDGWPNAGQVMRFFRDKAGMTAKTFGKFYGKETRVDGKPIGERWILEMELENKVPTDITRRRIIAHLLHIPLGLFGLASLEDVTQVKHAKFPLELCETNLENFDISIYERNIRTALHLHLTSNAKSLLSDIKSDRGSLIFCANQARGNLLYRIKELIVANDLLAAKIVRDQRRYLVAYNYASHALLVAESMEDHELMATACYTRGCIKLQWGQFDKLEGGSFQLDRGKINDAISDFQSVLNMEISHRISLHPQLRGFVLLQLSRAQGLFQVGRYDLRSTHTLKLADQAAITVERDMIDDLYTRMIVTGTVSGLHLGGYYLTRADIFNTVGFPDKAMRELAQLNCLIERTYGKDETRNQAWHDIVQAKVLIGLREFPEATKKVQDALMACHAIRSLQNIAIIASLHSDICASFYGNSGDVRDVGEMLEEWYGF
jgi:hypothetical protein